MHGLEGGPGAYEAPTACRLEDGSYCLMLDYFIKLQSLSFNLQENHCKFLESSVQ